ncbi:uncharacterized protein LOC130791883 [Actinidia eriantha]|uniref:uncharacterized protein LOC130791883 n=1 Tax=Actinidia eriantha TaxID=165200 RepID=UPI002588A318|nr:uncharacterized protein LOC130791883 [Actinidia eriantha]
MPSMCSNTSLFKALSQGKMQKRDSNNNLKPLGFCNRLFNFIMDSLLSRALKRVTMARESNEVPVEGPSSSEITVEFRHAKKDSPLVNGEKQRGIIRPSLKKEIAIVQVGEKELEPKEKVAKNKEEEKIKRVEETTMKPPGVMFLNNNINEKSDAFIRRKREDLSRTNSLEQP